MLQLNVIREKKDFVIERLAIKNIDAASTLDKVLSLDADKRKKQTELEGLLAEQNAIAKQIGELFKSGNKDGAEDLKAKSTQLKERSKVLEEEVAKIKLNKRSSTHNRIQDDSNDNDKQVSNRPI
jgi:seryl-tRNA synthetase